MTLGPTNKPKHPKNGFFGMLEPQERHQKIAMLEQNIKGTKPDGTPISDAERIGALNHIGRLENAVRDDVMTGAQISTQRMANTLDDLADRIEGKPPQQRNDPYATLYDTTPEQLQQSLDRSRQIAIKGKNNLAANMHTDTMSDADPIEAIGANLHQRGPCRSLKSRCRPTIV